MKNSKGKPTSSARTQLVENPEYTKLLKQVQSVSYNEALGAIAKLLRTPQRLTKTAKKFDTETGKPVKFSTTEDKSSVPNSVFFMPDSGMGIEVHKSVAKKFTALLTKLEKSNGSIVVRDEDDSQNLIAIVMQSISTGGGHNSMTTYSNALVFHAVALTEYIEL